MARCRNIKPGFFLNEALAELPPLARLLFIGLWTEADREGRIEDRPKRLKAQLFPYDDCDVVAMLADLARMRDASGAPAFILRYEVAGQRFVQVVNWHKHQQPHCKERASTIPAPCKHGASTVQAPEEHMRSTPDSLSSDSLSPPTPSRGPSEAKRFRPPVKAEVEAYIREKGYSFSADAFLDHYQANGWKRGKTPIVDWQAACRTWENRRREAPPPAPRHEAPAVRFLP